MNPIKDVIKFIYKDFKSDFTFLYGVLRGKANIRKVSQEEWNELKDFGGLAKANWLLFLLLTLAFTTGIGVSANYYENKANNFIIENCIDEYGNSNMPESPFFQILDEEIESNDSQQEDKQIGRISYIDR